MLPFIFSPLLILFGLSELSTARANFVPVDVPFLYQMNLNPNATVNSIDAGLEALRTEALAYIAQRFDEAEVNDKVSVTSLVMVKITEYGQYSTVVSYRQRSIHSFSSRQNMKATHSVLFCYSLLRLFLLHSPPYHN